MEVLMTMALIAGMAVLSLPVAVSFQTGNDLDDAASATAQGMRRAQTLSRSGENDTTWGLYVQTGSVTVFEGASYAARDASYDEVFSISDTITIGGLQEVVFDKLTGGPQATGTVLLDAVNNESRAVTINSKGTVDY
jgi:type II secretory pathway pseudopilin PulG